MIIRDTELNIRQYHSFSLEDFCIVLPIKILELVESALNQRFFKKCNDEHLKISDPFSHDFQGRAVEKTRRVPCHC